VGYASASELAQLVQLQQQLNDSSKGGFINAAIIKPPMLPPKGSHAQQPPYVAPPLYENLQDASSSSFSLSGKALKIESREREV
jgi:hypothetical protein